MAKKGRPTVFFHLDLEQVRKVAEMGWNDSQMSDFFGVHLSTWYRWKIRYPDFCESLNAWKDKACDRVERSLYERACGYSHPEDKIFKGSDDEPVVVKTMKHYPPDTSAATFLLKNYAPERFKDKMDHGIEGELTVKVIKKRFDGGMDDNS